MELRKYSIIPSLRILITFLGMSMLIFGIICFCLYKEFIISFFSFILIVFSAIIIYYSKSNIKINNDYLFVRNFKNNKIDLNKIINYEIKNVSNTDILCLTLIDKKIIRIIYFNCYYNSSELIDIIKKKMKDDKSEINLKGNEKNKNYKYECLLYIFTFIIDSLLLFFAVKNKDMIKFNIRLFGILVSLLFFLFYFLVGNFTKKVFLGK